MIRFTKQSAFKILATLLLSTALLGAHGGVTVPTTYPLGASGTFTLTPSPAGSQPAGNVPVWGSSCSCVTLTPAADGMSAAFKIQNVATAVGQSVTVSAVAPTYPDGTPGVGGQITFTLTASPYPISYTLTRTA